MPLPNLASLAQPRSNQLQTSSQPLTEKRKHNASFDLSSTTAYCDRVGSAAHAQMFDNGQDRGDSLNGKGLMPDILTHAVAQTAALEIRLAKVFAHYTRVTDDQNSFVLHCNSLHQGARECVHTADVTRIIGLHNDIVNRRITELQSDFEDYEAQMAHELAHIYQTADGACERPPSQPSLTLTPSSRPSGLPLAAVPPLNMAATPGQPSPSDRSHDPASLEVSDRVTTKHVSSSLATSAAMENVSRPQAKSPVVDMDFHASSVTPQANSPSSSITMLDETHVPVSPLQNGSCASSITMLDETHVPLSPLQNGSCASSTTLQADCSTSSVTLQADSQTTPLPAPSDAWTPFTTSQPDSHAFLVTLHNNVAISRVTSADLYPNLTPSQHRSPSPATPSPYHTQWVDWAPEIHPVSGQEVQSTDHMDWDTHANSSTNGDVVFRDSQDNDEVDCTSRP